LYRFRRKISSIITLLLVVSFIPAFAQEEPVPEGKFFLTPEEYQATIEPFYKPTQDALIELFTSGAESGLGIIGAIILILIGYLVGLGIGKAVQFFINRVLGSKFMKEKLDVDVQKDKDEGWYHVTNLIAPIVKWFVWIFFFVTAIDLLGFTEASEALSVLWVYIPNIIAFVVIIAVGTIAIKYIMKLASARKDIFGAEKEMTLQKTLVKAILYTIIFSIGITQLGVGEDVIPIIIWVVLGGIMATIVVSAGWGLKEFVPQFVKNKGLADLGVRRGAKIEVKDWKQDNTNIDFEILEVGLTHTKVKEGKDTKIIPNSSWQAYEFTLKKEVRDEKKD